MKVSSKSFHVKFLMSKNSAIKPSIDVFIPIVNVRTLFREQTKLFKLYIKSKYKTNKLNFKKMHYTDCICF